MSSGTSDDESGSTTTSTGPVLPCGNGDLDLGEECDDGNTDDSDACTAACTVAFCGDGVVWLAQEECDDGNDDEEDACTIACEERFPYVYMTILEESWDMWRYSAEDDSWETLTGPGNQMGSLTTDGESLYAASYSGTVWRYEPALDEWTSYVAEPPDKAPGDTYPLLVWTDDGLYLAPWSPFGEVHPIHVFRDETWSVIWVEHEITPAGSWDPVEHELYLRDEGELGFFVVDTTTDEVVREIHDPTLVTEQGRVGAYLDGGFYDVPAGGPLTRLDGQDGAAADTGITPTSLVPSGAVDRYKRQIYLGGIGAYANHLERYDLDSGTLTTLTTAPADPWPGTLGHSNLLVMYPGS